MGNKADKLRLQLGRQQGQCTWCGKPVSGRRRTWCSDECVTAFLIQHSWPYVRRAVELRDGGVCCRCGTDTVRLRQFVRRMQSRDREAGLALWRFYRSLGFPGHTARDWWEANHKIPRREGGTNDLDNLETLCLPCHKAETAAQRRRWARPKPESPAIPPGSLQLALSFQESRDRAAGGD
jgi:5-methylcytosine-specific restriction endonuclease McrA